MKFLQAERSVLEADLLAKIKAALKKGSVTLLVPGGSNISSVIRVLQGLDGNNNKGLTLLLSDERYGELEHADSNYAQMVQAGLNLRGANFVQTLTGSSLEDTVRYYAAAAQRLLSDEDETVIAFLGMGADGHVAGILPHSPAVEAVNEWAVSYHAGDFTRITLTPYALAKVDSVVVGAYGSEKGASLRMLAESDQSVADQPAQLLKRLTDVTIYNDQLDTVV